MSTAKQKNELISLLKDKEYRDAFVEASIKIGVPAQIRVLRKQREWSEEKLADEAKMKQPAISRLEDPTRGSVNLKTLLRIAAAFNVGLIVRFVPFGEMAKQKLKLSLESLVVVSFNKDPYFQTIETKTDHIEEIPISDGSDSPEIHDAAEAHIEGANLTDDENILQTPQAADNYDYALAA